MLCYETEFEFRSLGISACNFEWTHSENIQSAKDSHPSAHILLHRQTRWKEWESMTARISAQIMAQIDL